MKNLTSSALFLILFSINPFVSQAQKKLDVTSADYKDPFFVMQWVLKNPNGPYLIYTEKFRGDDGKDYFYLPCEFWADTSRNQPIKEELRMKFLKLYLPYTIWAESVSGIDYVLPLTMALRESTMGTSEHYVRSGGELFSIKLKSFQNSLGYDKGFYFVDNGKREFFLKLGFGSNFTTLNSFKVYLFTITQSHYIERLSDGGQYMSSRVTDWKSGRYPQMTYVIYSPEDYINCLCGYPAFNYAENCEGYDKTLAAVRLRLDKI